jgi:hypothetical protein
LKNFDEVANICTYIVSRQIHHDKRTIIVNWDTSFIHLAHILLLVWSWVFAPTILQQLQSTANGTTCNITKGIRDRIQKETCGQIISPLPEDKVDYSTLQRQNAENFKQIFPVPISTYMCLWANYIFPRWVCLFCWRNYVDRSWEYINRSQTHECGNWGWGRAIPRKGIYKRTCHCSA